MADNARDKERARKLAQGPTKSAFEKDTEDLARAKARDERDASVNNERTRSTGLFTSKGAQPIDDVVTSAQTGRPARRPKRK